MDIITIQGHKSIPLGLSFQLPKLTIITGKNGSGKSHLLEAMANNNITKVTEEGRILSKIIHIPFGSLSPQITERSEPSQLHANMKSYWQNLEMAQGQATSYISQHNWEPEQASLVALSNLGDHFKKIAEKITEATNKPFLDITESDLYANIRFNDLNNNSPFFSQFSEIFQSYQIRKIKNELNDFLNQKNGTSLPFLSADKFSEKFGPAPWDLVNSILSSSGLPYQVNEPDFDPDSTYILKLTNHVTGESIPANSLSTGEKVLMSLALAIYNTKDGTEKPDLILLDEPDAPLHPEFSKILIETLQKTITEEAGISVVITTHSPSTVAICPDNSLYQLNSTTKKPEMISIAEGLSILTSGIPHLKVSLENRLQVFVESKYDASYYERLYNLLSRTHQYTHRLVFLPPHSGDSNCTDVITITDTLTKLGNDLVRGIIDHDNNNKGTDKIHVLGNGKRYAIENYILDPLFICLALVKADKFKLNEFGITRLHTYIDAQDLNEAEAQLLINYVLNRTGIKIANLEPSKLENGFSVNYPIELLKMQGHAYESLLLQSIPELNAIKKGQAEPALKIAILSVIEDYSKYLSEDIHTTLSAIR